MIMPVNKKYPLEQLLAACDDYRKTKGRMISIEYVLIDGVNDSAAQASGLATIAQRLHAMVNLIPYNHVEGLQWKRPDRDRCRAFHQILKDHGIRATLRQEKGTEISAACGQLRLRHEQSGS